MNKIQTHHLYQSKIIDQKQTRSSKENKEVSFQSFFQNALKETNSLKMSKHASQRLTERNVTIHPEQWEKISQKVQEAKEKGITDSVVVTKDAALIVNTTNQTVITAMDRKEAATKLFSQINGVILID